MENTIQTKGSSEAHEKLIQETFLLFSQEFPGWFIFKRHIGTFYTKNGTPIKIGIPGQGDCYAIICDNKTPIHIELEMKSGSAKQSDKQKKWENSLKSVFGIYILIRKPEDILILKKFK